ncbi:MAG: DUF1353 domain-containing protein, partial [Mycoplasmataceae bacterium]|nr:DUF1353 domain-containing protein [Mycoplasmataceae bacterium]
MSYSVNGVHTYLDFDDNRQYLEKPLLIYTKVFNKRLWLSPNKYACFIVEKWESTDWASIPHLARTLTWLCPKDKKIMLPAIGHDHLYQKHKIQFYEFNKVTRKIWGSIAMIKITQNEAD